MNVLNVEMNIRGGALHIKLTHDMKGSCVYGFMIYRDGELIEDIKWLAQKEITYPLEREGGYKAVCFVRDGAGKSQSVFTHTAAYPADYRLKLATVDLDEPDHEVETDMEIHVVSGGAALCADAKLSTGEAAVYRFNALRNGKEMEYSGWSAKNSASIGLASDGAYQIEVIAETARVRYVKHSQVIQYQKKLTCNVHGSPASARMIGGGDKILLANYFSRQPVLGDLAQTGVSANALKAVLARTIFDGIRMKLLVNRAEYLLLDFLDEVVYGLKYNKGALKGMRGADTEIEPLIVAEAADDYIALYAESFQEAHDPSRVIIHKAYFMNDYLDKRGNVKPFDARIKTRNAVYNGILRMLYDKLAAYLPEAAAIDISAGFHADETAADGLSPVHYQQAYYDRAYQRLSEVMV